MSTTPSILRFEGHDYRIVGDDRPGITAAVRPGTKPVREAFETDEAFATAMAAWKAQTPLAEVAFATSDLTDSGEGWHYLPRRICPPLGGDAIEVDGKTVVLSPPHPLRDVIRLRKEWIAGRDDLAIAVVEKALA